MTFKKLAATLLCALIAAPAYPQAPYLARPVPLALTFDLDGEGVDAAQVVTVATLADSTTFTIAAQPDVCRLIDATVVDADSSISAGTLTITGTDCWGYTITATYAMTGGSGVRTGTLAALNSANPVKGSGAYFATITSVISGVLTGESGVADTLTVGVAAQAKSWPMYGRATRTPSGRRWVDVFGQYDVDCLVTNGAATTNIVGVSTSTTACFENVSVGDLLIFNINGEMFLRKVTTRTDADNIIVNTGVTIAAAGVNFSYKKLWYFADPIDGWIPVKGYDVVSFVVQVDANASTGGVVTSIECATASNDAPGAYDLIFEEDTATVATGATGTDTTTIDLRLKPHYTHCRASLKFGTTDDGDTVPEDIEIFVGFRQ